MHSSIDPRKRSMVVWKGSFFLDKTNENFQFFKKWKLQESKKYLFTVAYSYGIHRIHYVAFILDMSHNRLICFDPGYNLYIHGVKKIIPIVATAFRNAHLVKKEIVYKTACPKKYYRQSFGLQFNGNHPFHKPTTNIADAFCQTWTLCFLQMYVQNDFCDDLFQSLCRIHPSHREAFLINSFIIPCILTERTLKKRFSNTLPQIRGYLLENFWSKS